MKTRAGLQFRAVVAAVVLAGMCAGAIGCGRAHGGGSRFDGTILTGARFIAKVNPHARLAWINENEVLILDGIREGKPTVAKLDAKTGQRTERPELSRALRNVKQYGRLVASPDGKWLLATLRDNTKARTDLIRLSDGHVTTVGTPTPILGWLPDSSGWLSRETHTSPTRLNLVSGKAQTFPGTAANHSQELGVSSRGLLLVGDQDCYAPVPLVEYTVDYRTGKQLSQRAIAVPSSQWLMGASVSSGGRYLLSGAAKSHPNKLISAIQEKLGSSRNRDPYWITSADGTRVWSLGPPPDIDAADPETPFGVTWVPGGRYLSIRAGDELYMLRVDDYGAAATKSVSR
jgi:hypothetical protein